MICQTYEKGDGVLFAGEIPEFVYFITAGKASITTENATFKLAKLSKGSFFAEHGVLFHSPSLHNYYADDEEEEGEIVQLQLWCVEANYFVNLVNSFPGFDIFIRRRTLLRRAYFKRLEMKIIEQLEEFQMR